VVAKLSDGFLIVFGMAVADQGLRAHELDTAMHLITAALADLPVSTVVAMCGRFRDQLDAVESVALARVVAADGDAKRAGRLAKRRGSSRRDQARRARRAKAVAANPGLGDKLAAGDLSSETLDVLADAAAKSDDEALTDDLLIRRVGKAGPDQGRKIARDWLHGRENARSVNDRHARQRRLRSARRFDTADDMAAITLLGDHASVDTLWNEALAHADRMYRADGGRDLPAGQHSRTHDQRLFDAIIERLTSSPETRSENRKASSGLSRPTVVVTVTLDKLTGACPEAFAEQIGTGPIADAVLAKYLNHGNLVGLLFGTNGQPLWLGRRRRHASAGQFLALMVRDRGCVLCGAAAHLCHAHHQWPWHSPVQGTTDIDQLVLLCGSCHRRVHDARETVIWDAASSVWLTRPATANELPPNGRPASRTENRKPQDRPQRE